MAFKDWGLLPAQDSLSALALDWAAWPADSTLSRYLFVGSAAAHSTVPDGCSAAALVAAPCVTVLVYSTSTDSFLSCVVTNF